MVRLVLILLCLAAQAAAETRQHGNLIFDLSAGWDIGGARDDSTLTLLSDLPDDECGFCHIRITPGYDGQSRLDSYVFSQLTRFTDDDETPDRKVVGTPDMMNIAGRPGIMLCQKVGSDVQVLMAVQHFGRIELIAFEGPPAIKLGSPPASPSSSAMWPP